MSEGGEVPKLTKEQAIDKLYKKPFIYDQDGQRVVDQDNNWALDIRGWGRIQNLYPTQEEAAAAQDAFGEHVVKCLNDSTSPGSVAAPKPDTLKEYHAYLNYEDVQKENERLSAEIEHLKILIDNKNALIETYERKLESNNEGKA